MAQFELAFDRIGAGAVVGTEVGAVVGCAVGPVVGAVVGAAVGTNVNCVTFEVRVVGDGVADLAARRDL